MSIDEFKDKVPAVRSWIIDLLSRTQAHGRPVAEYNFLNLPRFYPFQILSAAKVVVVDQLPLIPLSSMGLGQFAEFQKGDYAGITYGNTYFVVSKYIHDEALHFHELIHVIQWAHLGVDKFLLLYGLGLLQFGYRNSPLEEMAYRYQSLFQQGRCPVDLVARVCNETTMLYNQFSKEQGA